MKKKRTPKSEMKKYIVLVFVFVASVVLFGASLSYAYFSAYFEGKTDIPINNTAILNVSTNLETVPVINAARLAIIDPLDYQTKGEKVVFTVTNETTSNINAKYTIKLVEMSLTKNLFSKYLKWKLVVNEGTTQEESFTGDFADATVASEGTSDTDVVSSLSKVLISPEDALTLNVGETDNIVFYIWLENDEVDQLYLTNGNFTGKLSMDAVPTR